MFSSSTFSKAHQSIFDISDYITSIVFSIEIFARIALAPYTSNEYKGKFGRIKFLFSFYNIIDFLSIIPFLGAFFGFSFSGSLKIFRVLRIWRIIRFIPSFGFITTALQKKKDEINASLLGVIFLSTTLSAMIYHVEKDAGGNSFKSVMQVLTWSIGKYTGDYGGIASSVPITLFGKILATINGLLGIALFALPAGLIGTAFIDEIGENKKRKELEKHVEEIDDLFEKSYLPNITLNKEPVYYRHLKFYSIQAELLISEEEMLKCIRFHHNFRCRINKGVDSIYLERFNLNTGYGFKKTSSKNKFFIINPFGEIQNGISHFTSSISDILNLNYISVETKIHDLKNNKKLINFDESHYFDRYKVNPSEVPIEFREFMADIYSIESDNTVLVIKTHKEGIKADFIVDEINVTQQSSYQKDDFFNNLKKREAKRIEYKCYDESKKKIKYLLKVEKRIRKKDEFDFSDLIHMHTKANVIILYINKKYLTEDHDIYYAIMQELINVIN
jgi:voltage-gated potassium channel